MKFAKKILFTGAIGLATLGVSTPAFASSVGSPNPALPGDVVEVYPDLADCGEIWNKLQVNDTGTIVVTWPDGTTSSVSPVATPANFTVPAGMQPGEATIQLFSPGKTEPLLHSECDGNFTIAEDATVPVVDPLIAAGMVAVVGAGVTIRSRRRNLA